jgi:glycine/D-amino acid oxidase-like deaminating enzyme
VGTRTDASDTWPWPTEPPTAAHRAAYADADPAPFWLDTPARPDAGPALAESIECDLAVVGAGLSGLWSAVLARERDPTREVVVLEGDRVANAASGRNGGFFISSLTHGIGNGLARFPDELGTLERLGLDSFAATAEAIERYGIDCGFERTGDIVVALEPHELEWLEEDAALLRGHGHEVEMLDRDRVRAEVASDTYLAGRWQKSGSALVDPARLSWGLARAVTGLGARIFENTRVERLARRDGAIELRTGGGTVRARRVVLATSAFPGLVGAIRRRVVPVYDYVLVTEPLSREQRDSIGWRRRQGVGDTANQFHYYRLTADDRILWGGFDAVYHYGSGLRRELEQSDRAFAMLAQHFFTTFPQLEGIRFSHRWGGAIDTCSRFFAFTGTSHGGRVAHTVGHTGLGVCASRFGAGLALDLLDGVESEAAGLRSMRSRPTPFPPEPLRWAAIELTRNRLAAADRRQGRRGLWLRTLDCLGLGFDS